MCVDPDAWESMLDEFEAKYKALKSIKNDPWLVKIGWLEGFPEAFFDPNPNHSTDFFNDIENLCEEVAGEASTFGDKVVGADKPSDLDAALAAFETWKAARKVMTKLHIELIILTYREVEKQWLQHYLSHDVSQDPVHLNKQNMYNQKLSLISGTPSKVVVETRCSFSFDRSPKAVLEGKPVWQPADEQAYVTNFQAQLDAVWGTKANEPHPFAIVEPKDHLLAGEAKKWSNMTGTLQGKVTKVAPANAHFKIRVTRLATGESGTASVSGGESAAHYFEKNAKAGLDPARPMDQKTLAHEWWHMIGGPDEYAKINKDQAKAYFAFKKFLSSGGDRAQAIADWEKLKKQYKANPATGEANIYDFSADKRPDIPDFIFSSQGTEHDKTVLRPGEETGRGGLEISSTKAQETRLSDEGNRVEPYMREGIVEGLNEMIDDQFDPKIKFEHNMATMTRQEIINVIRVRYKNVIQDRMKAFFSSLG